MKKFFLLLILNSAFSIHNTLSQTAPVIQWQNTIGGSSADWIHSIEQTTDGGYILGGFSDSNISGDKTENSNGGRDYWLVKTDASGNIQWQNTIGGNDWDDLHSIQQTADGGYILGGESNSNISGDKTENCVGFGSDYWIVKTDASGSIQWQNTIGGSSGESFNTIQQTADGGYILGGYSGSNISGDKTENCIGGDDFWIVKTDDSGNIQWQNTIGGNSGDRLNSIQQTPDGGYILGGDSYSGISGDKTENSNGSFDYYPNAFSNSSTISFFLSHSEKVSLKIFDANGRLVSTLAYKMFDAGENEITCNAADINAGVYFLRMETTTYSENQKLIMVK